jgi:hypothetical protein
MNTLTKKKKNKKKKKKKKKEAFSCHESLHSKQFSSANMDAKITLHNEMKTCEKLVPFILNKSLIYIYFGILSHGNSRQLPHPHPKGPVAKPPTAPPG